MNNIWRTRQELQETTKVKKVWCKLAESLSVLNWETTDSRRKTTNTNYLHKLGVFYMGIYPPHIHVLH